MHKKENSLNIGKKKLSRRDFLEKSLKVSGALALSGLGSACEREEPEIKARMYKEIIAEFEKKNLKNTAVFHFIKNEFGPKAFKRFRKAYPEIEYEEAKTRFLKAVNRRIRSNWDSYFERAYTDKRRQEAERIAREMGIDVDKGIRVEFRRGKMVSINGIPIGSKESGIQQDRNSLNNSKSLGKDKIESAPVDTSVY